MFSTGGWHDYIDFVLGCTSLQETLKMFKINSSQVMLPCPPYPKSNHREVLVARWHHDAMWRQLHVWDTQLGIISFQQKFVAVDQMRWLEQIQTLLPYFSLKICLYSRITHTQSMFHSCGSPESRWGYVFHAFRGLMTPTGLLVVLQTLGSPQTWITGSDFSWGWKIESARFYMILWCSHHAVDCQGSWGNPWKSLFAWWHFYQ